MQDLWWNPAESGWGINLAHQDDTVFAIPDAGEYFFRCDVHPTIMTGAFIVE